MGTALFMLSVFILWFVEAPSFIILLAFLIIAAAIVIGGILRIVNIVRTPTEEEPVTPPVPVVQLHQVDNGQNPGQQTVVFVQQAQTAEKQTKGRVWGTLGMLYMGGYALYIKYVIDSANVTNLGEAIGKAAAYNIFQPFFYCVLASALLSFVGVVGKNKTCILLALTATIGAAFVLTGALEILLIPAVLFLISYIRMAK
ncbi:MAG: hypothetical protein J6V52_01690 [Bacteroidaceae bacterium]|nr:hypothetical protein [Bacteroidaceae bacterium]